MLLTGLNFTGSQQATLTELHNTYEWVNWIELKYESWDSAKLNIETGKLADHLKLYFL